MNMSSIWARGLQGEGQIVAVGDTGPLPSISFIYTCIIFHKVLFQTLKTVPMTKLIENTSYIAMPFR